MNKRRARRAILPALGAGLAAPLVPAAFAHQAAAQDLPAQQPASRQHLAAVRIAGPPAAHQPAALTHSPAHAGKIYPLIRVRPGDTMSGIARSRCRNPADWTGIYAASRALHLTGANPDMIMAGQMLALSCIFVPASLRHEASVVVARHYAVTGPASSPRHDSAYLSYGHPYYCGDGDHDGYDVTCESIGRGGSVSRETSHGSPAGTSYSSGRSAGYQAAGSVYHGSGGCQAHIIADESGGNARAVNPSSGAGGLYQFLPSTWQGLGHSGLPENASVAEQNQAYYQQVAQSGYTAWDASGGCG